MAPLPAFLSFLDCRFSFAVFVAGVLVLRPPLSLLAMMAFLQPIVMLTRTNPPTVAACLSAVFVADGRVPPARGAVWDPEDAWLVPSLGYTTN